MTRSVFGIANGVTAAVVATMLYALAIAIQVECLCFHSFALTRAPVAGVQPILAAGVLFVVLFAFLVLGERLRLREGIGIAFLIGGIGLLARVLPQDLGLALAAFATAVGLVARFRSQRATGRSLG